MNEAKHKGFNNIEQAREFFAEYNGNLEPWLVPEGEDPFTPAHLWDQLLAKGEDPCRVKKPRATEMEMGGKEPVHMNGTAVSTTTVPPLVSAMSATAKQPQDPVDDAPMRPHDSLQPADNGGSNQRTSHTLMPSTNPTASLLMTNLPNGVTVKVLQDVFQKYGDLVGVYPVAKGEAVVRYNNSDAARWMRSKNNGRSVADNNSSIQFVDIFEPPDGPAPMHDDATVDGLTISTKKNRVTPERWYGKQCACSIDAVRRT